MNSSLEVECQFISAGYNLKQWDLIRQVNQLNSLPEYEVSKTPGTEFLSPVHPTGRQLFSTVVVDSSASTVAALIVSNQELYLSNLIEGFGFKKIILDSPRCIVFIGSTDSFIAVGCNKGVCIVDTKIPKEIEVVRWSVNEQSVDSVICIDCSHDPKNPNFIALGTQFGKLCYLTCFRDKTIHERIDACDSFPRITNLKFSPHLYSCLVTAHSNGLILIWDLYTKTILHSFDFDVATVNTSLDFSPCRTDILCIGRNNGVICIIDFNKMQKVIEFRIPDSAITALLFIHNGMDLIVGDEIGQIHIYNLRTIKPSRAYRLHSSTLKALVIKRRNHSLADNLTSLINTRTCENLIGSNSLLSNSSQPIENTHSVNFSDSKTRADSHCTTQNPFSNKGNIFSNPLESSESPIIISPLRSNYDSDKLNIVRSSKFRPNVHDNFDGTNQEVLPLLTKYIPHHLSNSQSKCQVEEISTQYHHFESEHSLELPYIDKMDQDERGQNKLSIKNDLSTYNIDHKDNIVTNSLDYSSFQVLFENHLADIKEFFGQQIINLIGELTRNVTNQQIQITSLQKKIDLLGISIDRINRTLLNNPHLL